MYRKKQAKSDAYFLLRIELFLRFSFYTFFNLYTFPQCDIYTKIHMLHVSLHDKFWLKYHTMITFSFHLSLVMMLFLTQNKVKCLKHLYTHVSQYDE